MVFTLVVLDLASSVLRQEIGWEERLQNNLFLCRMGHKTSIQSTLSLDIMHLTGVVLCSMFNVLPELESVCVSACITVLVKIQQLFSDDVL